MARLIVVAEATYGAIFQGIIGTSNDLWTPIIVVSVTTSDGRPVADIPEQRFRVNCLMSGQLNPQFLQAAVIKGSGSAIPGVYILGLQPSLVLPFYPSQKFIYAVSVVIGEYPDSDFGQTLTTLQGPQP